MEIEQLVSIIRHMRAQKQAFDYLDEALTAVMDVKEKVAAGEKAVAEMEAVVADKKAACEKLEADQKVILKEFKARQDTYKQNALAEVEQQLAAKSQEVVKKVGEVDALAAQAQAAQVELVELQGSIASLKEEKEQASAEVARIKQAIADLKARL